VEKGCVFDIKRFTLHDGPGLRTTVFFKGCPLRCFWCHNPEGMAPEPEQWTHERRFDGRVFKEEESIGEQIDAQTLFQRIVRDNTFYEQSGGGVSFSGGEPLMQPAFLQEMLEICARNHIHTAVDTSGYASASSLKSLSKARLLLFDLKQADEPRHLKGTGVPLQNILENLHHVLEFSIPLWLRLPMIPGYNTDEDSLEQMLALLHQLKNEPIQQIHLLPFHASAQHKYQKCQRPNPMSAVPSLSKEALYPFKERLRQQGWEQVYIGG
jgi:Pyruvate-formate lyase-activating enzyme